MTRRHTPLQQVKEAKQIARDHSCFVIEKRDSDGIYYLLYRQATPRNVYVGKRRNPADLRRLVCDTTGFH